MEKIESLARKIGEEIYNPKNTVLINCTFGALDIASGISWITHNYPSAVVASSAAISGHLFSYIFWKMKRLDEECKIKVEAINEETEEIKKGIYKSLNLLRNPASRRAIGIEELFTEENYSY